VDATEAGVKDDCGSAGRKRSMPAFGGGATTVCVPGFGRRVNGVVGLAHGFAGVGAVAFTGGRLQTLAGFGLQTFGGFGLQTLPGFDGVGWHTFPGIGGRGLQTLPGTGM
jgi:hypothetical protein